MFNIFNKKNKSNSISKLDKQYQNLMQKWHKLSSIDRKASDEAYAQAQEILKEIEEQKSK